MRKQIHKETNPDYLREMLAKCEREIEELTYIYRNGEKQFCRKNEGKIRKKVEFRSDILNRLFELHFNATDCMRLSQINSILETYEKNMVAKHIDMSKQIKEIDNNYTLYSYLIYRHDRDNPHLNTLEDDSYYSYNWNEMIDIIRCFSFNGLAIFKCEGDDITVNNIGSQDYDQSSWLITSVIKPCYSFWKLTTSHCYSIPDILQMTTYKFLHEVLYCDNSL